MSLAAPPRTDELEVSLFGPGVGECVIVHLGAGEWMVVDSCLDPATRMGHVRVRQNTDGTAPRVELFGAAFAE